MKRLSTLTLFRRATIRKITRTSINRIEQRNSNANFPRKFLTRSMHAVTLYAFVVNVYVYNMNKCMVVWLRIKTSLTSKC